MTADVHLVTLGRLDGRVALVTGAASGIGLQVVRRFAEAGALVHAVDHAPDAIERAAGSLGSLAGAVRWHEADVTDPARAAGVVDGTRRDGGVDVLVNNAGVFPNRLLLDCDAAAWRALAAVNIEGVLNFLNPTARLMIEHGRGGAIVNIASVAGIKASTLFAHYGATKAAVINISNASAAELGKHRIRVNAIAPGGIVTPGFEVAAAQAHANAASGAAPAPVATRPLPRLGTPDDVALAALYLAGEMASYVTGATLVVDGGALVG